ncbi:MAG: phosphate ABC transporter permease subunit PstC [Erysipelotrichales bacterium]
MKKKSVRIYETLFKSSSILVMLMLFLIIIFIFMASLPLLKEYNLINIIFNNEWSPTSQNPQFGLLNMLSATLISTFLALLIGIPIGLGTSIYLAKIAPPKVKAALISIIEVLAGIPSVIYGFFILKTVVALIYKYGNSSDVSGNGMLAAIIVLAIMVLPTIITISTTSLGQVDKAMDDASYALGANRTQTIFKVDFRAAKSGILASILLGVGKVVGETMAVMLVCGNLPLFPSNLLLPTRTLTTNIATDMAYANGVHQSALFFTGVVLFVIIIILNLLILRLNKKAGA